MKPCLSALLAISCAAFGQSLHDLTLPHNGDAIVIGMLGGFERWNDSNRGVRKLALKLNEIRGVHAETVENRHEPTALRYILRSLDANHNGKLDARERAAARVILYGQSLGGGQVVALAHNLNRQGIPVLLTVQVDSVGLRDRGIPPNVQAAANFYQRELFTVWGQDEIRPVDPSRTQVLANVRFHYAPFADPETPPESWARRHLGGGHARLEADPQLWSQVETLIRDALAGLNRTATR